MPRPPKNPLNPNDTFGRLTVIRCVGSKAHGPKQIKSITYLCRCSCGNEIEVIKGSLTSNRTQSCGCLKAPEDLTGHRVGKWTVLKIAPRREEEDPRVRWECQCECGTIREVLGAYLRRESNPSCGCGGIAQYKALCAAIRQDKMCGEVPSSFLHPIKNRAKIKGYECTLTLQDISDLYEQQGRKCYLTGLPIHFDQVNILSKCQHTASPDRIDSTKGYTRDNVCLVHKDLNRIKNAFPLDIFLNYCRLVAETHPQPKSPTHP